jgi:hypothetical protein
MNQHLELLKQRLKLSDICPEIKDYGTSTCPFCGGVGKGYSNHNRYRCYRQTCISNIPEPRSYNPIDLYRLKHNLLDKKDFIKALNALSLEHLGHSFNATPQQSDRSKLLEQIVEIYNTEIRTRAGNKAIQFLRARGFKDELIDMLSIGYASSSFTLRQYGLSTNELSQYGLISNGNEVFNDRIIYPVRDRYNHIQHLTGRSLSTNPKWKHSTTDQGVGINKYLALEENISTYGSDVMLCEGYHDTLALYGLGINSLGTFGLYGINNHIDKLRHFTDITAVYDIDCYPEDDPHKPKEYKSWSVVLPQLIDLQLLCPRMNIYLFFIPYTIGEGGKPCKDINDWLLVTKENPRSYINQYRVKLVDYCIDKYAMNLHDHRLLIDLCTSVGYGLDKLVNYIPSHLDPLSYAVKILA